MNNNQEDIFINHEADAWFDRNISTVLEPVSIDHNVIHGMISANIPKSGCFIDLGGGAGQVAAGITKLYSNWKGSVLEPSNKAIKAGSKVFPWIDFKCGSLTKEKNLPDEVYDLAIISMVFSWIDRNLLSKAIANVDNLVKPGGYIIIQDFYAPFPRANNYQYDDKLFTYKQDYSLPFIALNIYTELYRKSGPVTHTSCDKNDMFDTWLMTTVLKKDLLGRYKKIK